MQIIIPDEVPNAAIAAADHIIGSPTDFAAMDMDSDEDEDEDSEDQINEQHLQSVINQKQSEEENKFQEEEDDDEDVKTLQLLL